MIKLFNRKIMYALSILFFGLSLFFVYVIVFNLDTPENLVETSMIKENLVNECATKARELGIEQVTPVITAKRKSLVLKQKVVADPMRFAIKTANLQNYCKELELQSYCLGNECRRNPNETSHQFNMTLVVK